MTAGFSFDTSSLMNGRRDLLPPEVFPSLWDAMDMLIENGTICCVDVVRDEMTRRDDDLAAWAKARPALFEPLEEDVQLATRSVMASHGRLVGKGGGRNGADPFVIGLAVARSLTVVTEETRSGSLDRPRIPDVCEAVGVAWTNLVGFVRGQGWRF